jgi:probable F420-dependent oxidoreductase
MYFAICVVPFGDYANPRPVVALAQAAEAAGWEAIFVWDHLAFAWGVPSGDPWIILAAATQATRRIRLGTAVTPLPRRRPHIVANAMATLDQLSGGRMIFGAGLGGVPREYAAFGEPEEASVRGAMLDEGLEILDRLWSGEVVSHEGRYYQVRGVALGPLPVQRPRVPIWIGGESKPALRRAARWDGWVFGGDDENAAMVKEPGQVAESLAYLGKHRSNLTPFDVAMTGVSAAEGRSIARDYEAAGVTWWLESIHGFRGSHEQLLARVKAGPPG